MATSPKAWGFLSAAALSLCLVLLGSCSPKPKAPPEDDPPNTIGPEGGQVTLEDSGSPVHGMTIAVPVGAYPQKTTFHISTRPYEGKKSGKFTPLTPVIRVDNGGQFAEKIMTVTIPIALAEGMFAMGFFIDETGKLEPMPIVDLTRQSITIATRHFSEFLIGAIAELDLPEDIRTGFVPGKDDWQFANRGSYICPGGHCAGQSITAAWYYYEKRLRGEQPLHGRYDNNGGTPTPDVWEDDSLGYRLASTVQMDVKFDTELREFFKTMGKTSPDLTWKAFLYSMHLTGEPQYVRVHDTDEGGGHALLAYAANKRTGVLYVADPNYPGDKTRCIVFFNGVFIPYPSGSSLTDILAGKATTYEEIVYCAKTAMIPWAKVAARWAELEAGTIGHGRFPGYGLMQEQPDGRPGLVAIPDVTRTAKEHLEVTLVAAGLNVLALASREGNGWAADSESAKIPLKLGINRLEFVIRGKCDSNWEWVDFCRLTVVRVEDKPHDMNSFFPEVKYFPGEQSPWQVSKGDVTDSATRVVRSAGRTYFYQKHKPGGGRPDIAHLCRVTITPTDAEAAAQTLFAAQLKKLQGNARATDFRKLDLGDEASGCKLTATPEFYDKTVTSREVVLLRAGCYVAEVSWSCFESGLNWTDRRAVTEAFAKEVADRIGGTFVGVLPEPAGGNALARAVADVGAIAAPIQAKAVMLYAMSVSQAATQRLHEPWFDEIVSLQDQAEQTRQQLVELCDGLTKPTEISRAFDGAFFDPKLVLRAMDIRQAELAAKQTPTEAEKRELATHAERAAAISRVAALQHVPEKVAALVAPSLAKAQARGGAINVAYSFNMAKSLLAPAIWPSGNAADPNQAGDPDKVLKAKQALWRSAIAAPKPDDMRKRCREYAAQVEQVLELAKLQPGVDQWNQVVAALNKRIAAQEFSQLKNSIEKAKKELQVSPHGSEDCTPR